MNEFASMVSSVGFPIVCAGALFWYIVHVQSSVTDALNNNNKLLERLATLLSKKEEIGDV